MTFSIKKSFKDSWKMFFSKKIYLSFVLTSLVAVLGLYIAFGLSGFLGTVLLVRGLWWVLILVGLVLIYFSAYFVLVSVNLPLSTYETGTVNFKKIFKDMWHYKLILQAVGLLLCVGLVALAGGYILSLLGSLAHPILSFVLFACWVAFIAVRFAFSLYILVESKSGIFSSLKKSHSMMKGNGWKFLLFVIAMSVVSIVVQIIGDQFATISPLVSEIIVILFGIVVAPWFSLLTVSSVYAN
jgi:hypothetical protein